jgi:hypothetical protein
MGEYQPVYCIYCTTRKRMAVVMIQENSPFLVQTENK